MAQQQQNLIKGTKDNSRLNQSLNLVGPVTNQQMDQESIRQDVMITLLVKDDTTTHHNITHVVEKVVMTMGIITMTIITMVTRDTQHSKVCLCAHVCYV